MSQCFPHLSLAFVHTAMRVDKTKAKYMYLPIYYVINYVPPTAFWGTVIKQNICWFFNFHRAFAPLKNFIKYGKKKMMKRLVKLNL